MPLPRPLFHLVLSILAGASSPQAKDSPWIAVNPNPYLAPVQCLYFQDTLRGWVGGTALRETRDGGSTWERKWQGEGDSSLAQIAFGSARAGLAIGDGGLVLRTEDSGSTWSRVPLDAALNLREIFYGSEDRILILADGMDSYSNNPDPGASLWESLDGGETWDRIFESTLRWTDVHFSDSKHGFAIGTMRRSGFYYVTTDGGVTWTDRTGSNFPATGGGNGGPFISMRSILFLDSLHGFVTCIPGGPPFIQEQLFETKDGGFNWELIPMTPWLSAQFQLSIQSGVIRGLPNQTDRKLVYSEDSGRTWNQTSETESLRAFSFPTPRAGFAVRTDSRLVKTSDNGASWVDLGTRGPETKINQILMASPTAFFAVTGDSTYVSQDSGRTWKSVEAGDKRLRAGRGDTAWLIHYSPNKIYPGESQPFLKTENGGDSWAAMPEPFPGGSQDMFFISGIQGWALDTTGNLLRKTENGGVTWQDLAFPFEGRFKSLYFLDSLTGWAVGQGSIKTLNGGKTWEAPGPPNSHFLPGANRIRFSPDGIGWIGGQNSSLLRISDSGNEMKTLPGTESDLSALDFGFINGRQGWVQTGKGLFLTQDAGATWIPQEVHAAKVTASVFAADGVLWVGASNGEILYRSFESLDPNPVSLRRSLPKGLSKKRKPAAVDLLGRWKGELPFGSPVFGIPGGVP